MKFYRALERKDGNNWTGEYDFTLTDEQGIRKIGFCADPRYMCDHRTAIEASDCYRRFCIQKQEGMMGGAPMGNNPGWGEDLEIKLP